MANTTEINTRRVTKAEIVARGTIATLATIDAAASGMYIENNMGKKPAEMPASALTTCAYHLEGLGMGKYDGSKEGRECEQKEEDMMMARVVGGLGVIGGMGVAIAALVAPMGAGRREDELSIVLPDNLTK